MADVTPTGELAAALAKAQGAGDHELESKTLYAHLQTRERSGWQQSKRPMVERLLNRVICGLSDCWHFCGTRNEFGYGRLTVGDRLQVAHRLSYQTFVGPIPDGLSVLHRCDNPACINPDHLWLGTQSDNRRDCHTKGRTNLPRGADHWTRRRRS